MLGYFLILTPLVILQKYFSTTHVELQKETFVETVVKRSQLLVPDLHDSLIQIRS